MSARSLEGLGVVVTRPLTAAHPLAQALEREGARVFVFPALVIEEMELSQDSAAALADLAHCTLAIFVSANAVEHGLAASRRYAPWPASTRVAGIGEATAQALHAAGFVDVIAPRERHDSDALLALPVLRSVKNDQVLIFRGEGGRERLRDVLESRGATVRYVECYRRAKPAADAGPLKSAWKAGEIHAVSVLSAQTLENFLALLGEDADALAARAVLVVPHEAVAAHPDARRFASTRVARPGAAGVIEALQSLHAVP
jgi:uroporphyrinogen-III synthase